MYNRETLSDVAKYLTSSSRAHANAKMTPQKLGILDRLLGVIASKTGYPIDMLGATMDLESDLGIDSIKRVEIFAELNEHIPEAALTPETTGGLRTIGAICSVLESTSRLTQPRPETTEEAVTSSQ